MMDTTSLLASWAMLIVELEACMSNTQRLYISVEFCVAGLARVLHTLQTPLERTPTNKDVAASQMGDRNVTSWFTDVATQNAGRSRPVCKEAWWTRA